MATIDELVRQKAQQELKRSIRQEFEGARNACSAVGDAAFQADCEATIQKLEDALYALKITEVEESAIQAFVCGRYGRVI